jgi:histidinol-phosphate phosphatase family protein
VKRLHAANVAPVVITNQSGIAQGLITEAAYHAVRARIDALFAQAGAPLLAQYHCPHYPSVSGPCRCRKPGTGLFQDASVTHNLDVSRSMFVGDRRRDVEPALSLGGWGILVPSEETSEGDVLWAEQHANVADSLEEAVIRYLAWLGA